MKPGRWILIFLLGLFTACKTDVVPDRTASSEEVALALNDWHSAAAEADFDRYFNHFTGDSAIFMGTDASERWTIAEFKPWAKPYFEGDDAWSFTPVERHIYFSENGRTAWFDEELDTPNLGSTRGSGVLLYRDGSWKIAHYNLSIPIPNAIVGDVVEQIEKVTRDP